MTLRERYAILAAFLIILLGTFLAAILVGLGLFPRADPDYFRWLIGAGIVEILGAVIFAFRDSIRPKGQVSVTLRFPDRENGTVDLDSEECNYELKEGNSNQTKERGKLLPTLGPGGWQCILLPSVSPTDYIQLRLKEKNGDRWQVRWFTPLATIRDAIHVPD
ncbi:MAG: hypothetical protein HY532_07825 [Chloroflexi bacterium]|nr:hypothetical protein [Chloroflexota bacterium]